MEKLLSTIDGLAADCGQFSLIVIDTVARALLGADENSATDIGKFVRACDAIKEHTGAAVLGIHHSGKDGGKGMRGSSALLGAVDTSVKVKRTADVITLTTEKQKDAEPADDIFLKMNSIEVGLIGAETSVYLTRASAEDIKAEGLNLNDNQIKAMNCMRDATEQNGGINMPHARDLFNYWHAEREGADPTEKASKDRSRMAWRRSIDALLKANIVRTDTKTKVWTWVSEVNTCEQG